MSDGQGACLVCFPDYRRPAGSKPCEIRVGEIWIPGTLLEWQRDVAGGWNGLVTYLVGAKLVTTVKHQCDLRPPAGRTDR